MLKLILFITVACSTVDFSSASRDSSYSIVDILEKIGDMIR